MRIVTDVILQEMQAMSKMIRSAIASIDGDFWKKDENDWVYGYVLFHIIEAVDFYLGDSAESWAPMTEVSSNSREIETQKLQSKDRSYFESYIDVVDKRYTKLLSENSDKWILSNDDFAPRGFKSRQHKFTYVLRHSMVHLGELSKSLRAKGLKGIRWE